MQENPEIIDILDSRKSIIKPPLEIVGGLIDLKVDLYDWGGCLTFRSKEDEDSRSFVYLSYCLTDTGIKLFLHGSTFKREGLRNFKLIKYVNDFNTSKMCYFLENEDSSLVFLYPNFSDHMLVEKKLVKKDSSENENCGVVERVRFFIVTDKIARSFKITHDL